MRKSKNITHKSPVSIAVVADGKTEKWYLQMLKRNERNVRINIKPEIPNKKSLKEQYEFVCELLGKEYTTVFWIIDLDAIIKEEKEAPKGKKSPLRELGKYRRALLKKYPNVVVIINNPCLEFWLLLHFEKTSKYFRTCASAIAELKKHLNDYEKTQKYYTKENNDIYLKLKPHLSTAIQNAISLGCFDEEDPAKAMCEMELFFQSNELRNIFLV